MIEYWLQKKTIGGWSQVTRYAEAEKQLATDNFNRLSKGDSGFSWRLCEVKVIEEKLLVDHEEVEEVRIDAISRLSMKDIKSAWGEPKQTINDVWGSKPLAQPSWSDTPSTSEVQHGMVGKVWLINHIEKKRCRVSAKEAELLEGMNWERGGPKTPFRS